MDSLDTLSRRATTGSLDDTDVRWLITEVVRLRERVRLAEAVCWAKITSNDQGGPESAAAEAAAFHAWRTAPAQ